MKRIKIVYLLGSVERAQSFEWIADDLDREQFELSFVLFNNHSSLMEEFLLSRGIPVTRIALKGSLSKVLAAIRLCWKFIRMRPQVIHAHLFEAGLLGLSAAWAARVKTRIYTRHYSTFHHDYFQKGVVLDRWINRMSTMVIAISENVRAVLIEKEHLDPAKIRVIHHGFRLEEFDKVEQSRIDSLRAKFAIETNRYPVIGVIARFTELKGIGYIISAFKKLLNRHPAALLILANAVGDQAEQIQNHLDDLPEDSIRQIVFEPDIQALYKLFHLHVHVPINDVVEAFGQTYVEALAAGVPSIFTLSGVAREFIKDGENALVVPFQDDEAIYKAMVQVLEKNYNLNTIIENGKKDVNRHFSLDQMTSKLQEVYTNIELIV